MSVPDNKMKQIDALKRHAAKMEQEANEAEDRAVYWELMKEDSALNSDDLNSDALKKAQKSRRKADKCYKKIAELEQQGAECPAPQVGDVWQWGNTFRAISVRVVAIIDGRAICYNPESKASDSRDITSFGGEFWHLLERPPLEKGQAVYDKERNTTGIVAEVDISAPKPYTIRETGGSLLIHHGKHLIPLTLPPSLQ